MDIELFIEGADMTGRVDIVECAFTDAGPGASDHMELTLASARDMIAWALAPGERIRARAGGVDSGDLIVYGAWPEAGQYRIAARAMPESAARISFATYAHATLGDVIGRLAGDMGLEARYFGVDTEQEIEFALRDGVSAPAFMEQLLTPQAGVIKFSGGAINAISLSWALEQASSRLIELRADGTLWQERNASIPASCRVVTPLGAAWAYTSGSGADITVTDAPVFSDADALRWAQGRLLREALLAGGLRAQLPLDPALYALGAVTLTGARSGRHLILEAVHDFVAGQSDVLLTPEVEVS